MRAENHTLERSASVMSSPSTIAPGAIHTSSPIRTEGEMLARNPALSSLVTSAIPLQGDDNCCWRYDRAMVGSDGGGVPVPGAATATTDRGPDTQQQDQDQL